ncbi:MAG: type II secretion system F family protein, partial [Oscillospiraceae bacterium]
MARYNYLALDKQSKKNKGIIEAKNQEDLIKKLNEKGLFISWYKELPEKDSNKYKIKQRDLADFCREIGTMLSSGVTII